jgi:hypothetical protein
MRPIVLLLLFSFVNTSFARQTSMEPAPFESFHVFGPFNVTLVKSDREKVEIDYRGMNKEDVIIKSSSGELSIKFRNKGYFDNWDSDNNGPRAVIKVYFKAVSEIEARGGVSLSSDAIIEARDLYLTCSMGSEMNLNLNAEEVDLNASMGSEVKLSGTTRTFDMTAKMGADVKAGRLISEDVSVHASMGADVFVYASRKIDVSAGFGASVDYAGAAALNHSSKFFGADINSRRR